MDQTTHDHAITMYVLEQSSTQTNTCAKPQESEFSKDNISKNQSHSRNFQDLQERRKQSL